MKHMSDNPDFYNTEEAYMPMGSLGADATAPAASSPSWWDSLLQNASQAYATVKSAQTAAKTGVPVAAGGQAAPVSTGPSTAKILTYTAVGLVALWGISQMIGGRRRR